MTVFLIELDPPPGDGPTVAVKDLIDIEGLPTTCASRPVAETATPADTDAAVVTAIRAAGGRINGKTNLHELAFGGTGVNDYTGTPTNPLDPTRIPGGSSSGSAVAVATGAADVALGTDTGGSIRTPSACCGTVGLKTTFGRVSLDGIHPLAPSLDVVGPMAADVAGVTIGMQLLEPGFEPAASPAGRIGRFRLPGTEPEIDAALDRALATSALPTTDIDLPGWMAAHEAATVVAFAEALAVNRALVDHHEDALGSEVRERFRRARAISEEHYTAALAQQQGWRSALDAVLASMPVIALPGMVDEPPPLDDPLRVDTRLPHVATNFSGHPSIVIPVPRPGSLPASLQLLGRSGDEELLVATAAAIEAALA